MTGSQVRERGRRLIQGYTVEVGLAFLSPLPATQPRAPPYMTGVTGDVFKSSHAADSQGLLQTDWCPTPLLMSDSVGSRLESENFHF